MDNDEQDDRQYQLLKQQLWNQPLALKVLERMERHGAPATIVVGIARHIVSGRYGEAEVVAAVCTELLRNCGPTIIRQRAGDLRIMAERILSDLSRMAGEINQLKTWEAHRMVGVDDWTDFLEMVLGLSETVVEALHLAREQVTDRNLNDFLQAMIKGYVAPAGSQEKPWPAGDQGLPRPSDPQTLITALKAQLEKAEFDNGRLVRANHALKEELIQTRADTYREVQKREALINKLSRNFEPHTAQSSAVGMNGKHPESGSLVKTITHNSHRTGQGKAVMRSMSDGQHDHTKRDEGEDLGAHRSAHLSIAGHPRDSLIRRLALVGLPTREIVRLIGTPSRTITRILRRLGVKRTRAEIKFSPPPRRQSRRLGTILSQYYALDKVDLDALHQLARRNNLSLGKLFGFIREHVSPARWAMRTCLACSQSTLTSSPAERYCASCRKKVKKVSRGFEELTAG